jgi:replication factor A1
LSKDGFCTKITHEKKGRRALRNRVSPGEYLAFLSVKYEVNPDEFFYALISAEENQKSKCENLSIECRGETRDKVIFLILKGSKVVAQFSVLRGFLLERSNPIKNFMETDLTRRYLIKKNRGSHSLLIRDLRTGMSHVNLKAKVLEIPRPRLVVTRFGNCASVAHALIADETGTIKLCLWNEQINSVSHGDTIQIENARMSTFRGERQLSLGKIGTLSNIENLNL